MPRNGAPENSDGTKSEPRSLLLPYSNAYEDLLQFFNHGTLEHPGLPAADAHAYQRCAGTVLAASQ